MPDIIYAMSTRVGTGQRQVTNNKEGPRSSQEKIRNIKVGLYIRLQPGNFALLTKNRILFLKPNGAISHCFVLFCEY